MSEQEAALEPVDDIDENELTPGYKAPEKKDLNDIINQDADDESLIKYKKTLLGDFDGDSEDPRRVVVQKIAMIVEGRDDVEANLEDMESVKGSTFTLKEGVHYKLKMYFKVQHEIVSGLRYVQRAHKMGILVDRASHMIGSYGPKKDVYDVIVCEDEAPKGMAARGTYKVKSKIIDDYKQCHLEWEWKLEIKKDWEN